MRRYTLFLIPDLTDGGYTMTAPSLPGCLTEGDTLDQALKHVRDSICFRQNIPVPFGLGLMAQL